MQSEQLFLELKKFLENEPACQKTLGCLNAQAQIGIVVGGSLRICVQVPNREIKVEKATCPYPDFVFYASPQAVETMINQKNLSAPQLGIKFLSQILTQQITLAMPGHLFQILRKGYFDILKVGGFEFLFELRKYNLASVSNIISALRKLGKK